MKDLVSNTQEDIDKVRAIFASTNPVGKSSDAGRQLTEIVEKYTGKNEYGPAVPGDNKTMFGVINNNYHR